MKWLAIVILALCANLGFAQGAKSIRSMQVTPDPTLCPGLQLSITGDLKVITNRINYLVDCHLKNASTNDLTIARPYLWYVMVTNHTGRTFCFMPREQAEAGRLPATIQLKSGQSYDRAFNFSLHPCEEVQRSSDSGVKSTRVIELEGDYQLYVSFFVFSPNSDRVNSFSSNSLKVKVVK